MRILSSTSIRFILNLKAYCKVPRSSSIRYPRNFLRRVFIYSPKVINIYTWGELIVYEGVCNSIVVQALDTIALRSHFVLRGKYVA